jgi:hypothetical protein
VRRSRSFAWIFAAAALLPTLAVALFVFLADPYQHYRAADHVIGPMRYMAPGLALHHPYEGIVLGDSMSQNFLPALTTRILGRPYINLCLSGATYFEERTLLETALRSGQVREVLWGIAFSEAGGASDRSRLDREFPLYLYDADPLNDVRYLFNRDVLAQAVRRASGGPWGGTDLNAFNNWYWIAGDRPGRDQVLASFERKRFRGDPQPGIPPDYDLATMKANFDLNVLAPIRAHPEVRFNVFVPPFTTLYFVDMQANRPQFFALVVGYYRHVFHALAALPNVHLHDFDLAPLTRDLALYKDIRHYQLPVNAWILRQIKAGRYRVTPENADALFDAFAAATARTSVERLVADPGPGARAR